MSKEKCILILNNTHNSPQFTMATKLYISDQSVLKKLVLMNCRTHLH